MRFAMKAAELALAVPQVMSHRVARMVSAGNTPSARDQRELHRMSTEKVAAFGESWSNMAAQSLRANQQLSLSLMRSWYGVWLGNMPTVSRHSKQFQAAALDVLARGMAPVHRRAVANARRLNRAKRRKLR
jgi:hypothetical protein